jgi:uncharacterized phage protein gp47/JayE
MPDLQTKGFDTLVSEQVTAVQGGSKALVDFSIGSVLRAVVEAYAAVALWLQGLVLKLLATTRAATSMGADLDTWMADYGLARLPAVAATGQATFSRVTSTAQAVVPVGTLVQTADGSQQYVVTADSSNPAYGATAEGSSVAGYVLGAGVASVMVPIQAVVPGAAANAAIGGVAVLAQAVAGVDAVTNAAALANGQDAETDPALRTRFVQYLASLSKATSEAVGYAVSSVQDGISFDLVENEDYDGTPHLGYFYVVVDDGSGDPNDALISRVYAAVDAVRPLGSLFGVFRPVVVTASVQMVLTVKSGYPAVAIQDIVRSSVTTYINDLGLGGDLSWSRLIQVAYDADPSITNVSQVTINGSANDLTISAKQTVRAGAVTVATA